MVNRKTTTGKGLGWQHQQQRARLLRNHKDGAPCPCLDDNRCGPACLCRPGGRGLPMYRDAARNPDGMPLEADHTIARSQGGVRADRLLLAVCNRSRGAGTRPAPDADPLAPQLWWTRAWITTADTLS